MNTFAVVSAGTFVLLFLAFLGGLLSGPCGFSGAIVPVTPHPEILPISGRLPEILLDANGNAFVNRQFAPDSQALFNLIRSSTCVHGSPFILRADHRTSFRSVRATLHVARDAGVQRLILAANSADRVPSPFQYLLDAQTRQQ